MPWTCHGTGDCCRSSPFVVMSAMERATIEAADTLPAGLRLDWSPLPRGFQRLTAGPCPLLDAQNRCVVYLVRPTICRTFMCGRIDPVAEPFEVEPVVPSLGMTGCGNLTARLKDSLRFLEHYRASARKVWRDWAVTHGWSTSNG